MVCLFLFEFFLLLQELLFDSRRYLQDAQKIRGPFLVVCPLSILQNWENELEKFAPKLAVKTYIGDKAEREELRGEIVDEILKLPKTQRVRIARSFF